MAITAGDIINGYRLIESIADGGMGSVWKAKHPNLERLVAIKFIKPELLSADTVRQLFLEEVRHLSQLHAPQVVQVLDSGLTESNAPFMVTEYLPGVDLATHLDRHGALSPDTVCRIGIEVLKALSEAHASGIIHGDLKPSNIFLMDVQGQKQPVVKVLDFGVACLMEDGGDEESTLGGRIVRGSLQYMSPEQVTLGNLTFASDLYTLGATLYRLLTNHYVFEGESQEQMRQKLSEKAPSVASKVPGGSCPSALEDLVRSCLERKREDRPSSAQALRKRLEHIQSQLSKGVRKVTDTTAVDVSVPDWLQSGFSHTDSPRSESDSSASQGLVLDRADSSIRQPVLALDDPSDSTPLLEPPLEIGTNNELTLDVSRTVEQAAPSISQLKSGSGAEHFSGETVETRPLKSDTFVPVRKPTPTYAWVVGLVALALISISIGQWSDDPKQDKPIVKPPTEMEETAARLREAKALLAKLEKDAPRTVKPRVEQPKKESVRDIVLSLPRGKIGRFLNANTKTRLCAQMVMSCRVPRHLNVEVRAPNYNPRVFSSDELKAHPSELKSFRLDRRVPKTNKK
jgi:serine/threonine protein kinase